MLDSDDIKVDAWGFRGTCWDAASLIGVDSSLPLEISVVIFLVLLSATVQVLFIVIVFLNLVGSNVDDDTIDGFHFWRTNVGQDVEFMSSLTLESLASRVCRADPSLHLADRQVQYAQEIDSYVFDHAPFNGPLMCLLAMFAWILTVSKEFRALFDMWVAFMAVPRGATTLEPYGKVRLKVASLHPRRLFYIGVLTCLRVLIASALLCAGCLFLAVTISIEDILLNAVALEFVLNVDELVYDSLCPMKTRKLLAIIKPIKLMRVHSSGGVDFASVATIAFSFSVLGTLFGARLMPEIDSMKEAKNEICEGFSDFAYSSTSFDMTIWATEALDVQAKMDRFLTTSRYKVVREAIELGQDWESSELLRNHVVSSLTGPGMTVKNAPSMEIQSFGLNPVCFNMFFPGAGPHINPVHNLLLNTLRDAINNQTVNLCSEVEHLCHNYDAAATAVRNFCPQTCQCDMPGGSLWWYKTVNGCPDSCRDPAVSAVYKYQVETRTCTQTPTDLLVNDTIWKSLASNMKLGHMYDGESSQYYIDYANAVATQGWDMIIAGSTGSTEACSPNSLLKTLAFWCPLACGCNASKISGCPDDCQVGQPILFGTQTPTSLLPGSNGAWYY